MYHDLKERFWWYGMKRAVARICCGMPNIEARGFVATFEDPEWKWEEISMDFIVGLPGTRKFSYNNGYQSGLRRSHRLRHRMAKVRDTAILEPNGREVFGPDLIGDAEQQIKMLLGPDEKSYADVRREDLTFKVDDFVYLKVSPMRGIRRFNMKGKAAPRYIGPFKIVERKGEVAYKLELPSNLSGIHNVFHVSQLKKCLRVPEEQAPLEGTDVREDLTYTEHPVKILETSERVTRNRRVKMCRVQWKHHTEDEATWEREEELRATYPGLFANHLRESRGRDSC
ncbi:LOW QUALITY PROTEIN: hypothetical protein U9M48_042987 [Paspalum notatum var. saurae]|uniref:Chromo domain-containing protein n=1 Tax=Paspalum notatum var. saurae TaxID=547442 RepID=A0AAQ3UY90_PASNO